MTWNFQQTFRASKLKVMVQNLSKFPIFKASSNLILEVNLFLVRRSQSGTQSLRTNHLQDITEDNLLLASFSFKTNKNCDSLGCLYLFNLFSFFRDFKSFLVTTDPENNNDEKFGLICPRNTRFTKYDHFKSFELWTWLKVCLKGIMALHFPSPLQLCPKDYFAIDLKLSADLQGITTKRNIRICCFLWIRIVYENLQS